MDNEEELIRQYSRIAKVLSRRYFLFGGDSDDLYQEGMIGLLLAIRSYQESFNVSFAHYAECCIRRRMIDTIRLKGYTGYLPLPDDSDFYVSGPEEIILENEGYREFLGKCKLVLSKYEFSILNLYLKGYSISEVADKMNRNQSSIYNALQRIRQKLKNLSA